MKAFMDQDFLLSTETARRLYHSYAEKMPIVDYHCHINPAEIAENRSFDNITQLWLGGDHYKWRIMRANGVAERYITGTETTDREKFQKWAETLPKAIGNPLYHWTHLELQRYFGVNKPLNGDTAEEIWNACNEKLRQPELSVRGIISQSGVRTICTTDDPVDSLEYHRRIQQDPTCEVTVLPAFRPDKAMNINKPEFSEYLEKLGEAAGISINCFADVLEALKLRLEYFAGLGCRASDHGLDTIVYEAASTEELDRILGKKLAGGQISKLEEDQYKTGVLVFLGRQYARLGMVMQLHYGAVRNCNTQMFEKLGPDTGYDAILPQAGGQGLPRLLDCLNQTGELPKTIVYSLNPNDNEMIDTVIGCFQGMGAAGKLQHGSAWWFGDHKSGMVKQMTDLANLSLLGNFVGMLTDSRSFLSYTRHEYFRRILCDLIGQWVENGEYPNDDQMLGRMVADISYHNAVRYFGFEV